MKRETWERSKDIIQPLQPQYAWDAVLSREPTGYVIHFLAMPGLACSTSIEFPFDSTVDTMADFFREMKCTAFPKQQPKALFSVINGYSRVSAMGHTYIDIYDDRRSMMFPMADFHQPYNSYEIISVMTAFRNFALHLIGLPRQGYGVRLRENIWTPPVSCCNSIVLRWDHTSR